MDNRDTYEKLIEELKVKDREGTSVWVDVASEKFRFIARVLARAPNKVVKNWDKLKVKIRDSLGEDPIKSILSRRNLKRARNRVLATLIVGLTLNPIASVFAADTHIDLREILTDIKVEGVHLEFDNRKLDYTVELEQGFKEIPDVEISYDNQKLHPTVDVSVTKNLEQVPFTETITIKSNSDTIEYTIKFTVKDIEKTNIAATEINTQEDIYLNVGDTVDIGYELNENASIQLLRFSEPEWKGKQIFSVTEKGKLTAMNVGSSILALDTVNTDPMDNVNKQVNVHVLAGTEITAQKIAVANPEKTLILGEEYQISFEVLPAQAVDKAVEWESSNNEIVEVDETGLVVSKASGSAVITGTNISTGLAVIVKLEITEVLLENITISNKPEQLEKDGEHKLVYEVFPKEASPGEVIWVSDKPEVIEVSSTGLLTAKSEGFATIVIISSKGQRDEVLIEVTKATSVVEEAVIETTLETEDIHEVIEPVEQITMIQETLKYGSMAGELEEDQPEELPKETRAPLGGVESDEEPIRKRFLEVGNNSEVKDDTVGTYVTEKLPQLIEKLPSRSYKLTNLDHTIPPPN